MSKKIIWSFLLTLVLVGCNNEDVSQVDNNLLVSEINEINEVDDFKQFTEESFPFDISLEVSPRIQNGKQKIFFDIKVENPDVEMEEVKLSALLPEDAYNYIDASYLLFSNAEAVLDPEYPKENFQIGPKNSEIKSIAIGRTFILKNNEFSEEEKSEFIKIIKNIMVKVSWKDTDDNINIHHLKLPSKNIQINLE